MITSPALQILLSTVFVLTAVYSIYRVIRARTGRDRVGFLAHALMSVAMFAMVWPWGVDLLIVPQIILFSAATVWFLFLALRFPNSTEHAENGHHDGRRILAYHAAMMAGTVLMAVAMVGRGPVGMSSMPGDTGSMPGMDMSGGAGSMVSPLWVSISSLVAAIGFGIAALYYVGSTLAAATSPERARPVGRFRTADAGWNLLMAGGMAAVFIPMIAFG